MEKVLKTICLMCPIGCFLRVTKSDIEISVEGNTCPKGKVYGVQEITHPTRMVTSIVRLDNGKILPCKTALPVPKEKIFDVLKEIKNLSVKPPIRIGQVLIKNTCGTNISVVATAEEE